jgi:hypothetical protein
MAVNFLGDVGGAPQRSWQWAVVMTTALKMVVVIECTASERVWRLVELTLDHLLTASTLQALHSQILGPFDRL